MKAVWMHARSGLRRRWLSTLAVALITGIAGGAVVAAFAGARRTDTAYPRMLRASNAYDIIALSSPGGLGFATLDLDAVVHLPQVADSARADFILSQYAMIVSPDGSLGGRINKAKIIAGRAADPNEPLELVPGFLAMAKLHLHLGGTLPLKLISPKDVEQVFETQDFSRVPGTTIQLKIVGVGAQAGDFPPLPGSNQPLMMLTPAFFRTYGPNLAYGTGVALRLKRGTADLAAFNQALRKLAPGKNVFTISQTDQTRRTQGSIHTQGIALLLLGLLGGAVSLFVVGQALSRAVYVHGADNPTLQALGMSDRDLWFSGLACAAAIGIVVALVAAGIAIVLSPLTPFGLARLAEPTPGISVDASALIIGSLSVLILVPILAVYPAWRAARIRSQLRLERRSLLAGCLGRITTSPSSTMGTLLALEPGRGSDAVPVRTAIAGTAVGVAALIMAFTFGTSLTHLLSRPHLYGANYDVRYGDDFSPDIADGVVRVLRTVPGVAAFSVEGVGHGSVNNTRVDLLGVSQVKGVIEQTVLEGRAPTSQDEIMLGTRRMRDIHVKIGDVVTVGAGTRTTKMKVVGRGVIPDIGDAGALSEGGVVMLDALRNLQPEIPRNFFSIRFAPGSGDAQARLSTALASTTASPPKSPADLDNVGKVANLPLVLGGLLAALGSATLAHALMTGARRRRRELAVLKALGFVRRQVRGVVAWQASTLCIVALAVGVPAGIAGGRAAWSLFANQLGVVSEPAIQVMPIVLAVPIALIVANALGAAPAWIAARTPPAIALRTE